MNESPGRLETGGFFCSVKQFTLKLRSEVLSGIRSLHGPLLRATGETAPLRWGFSLLPPAPSSRTWGRPLVSTDSPGRDGAGADHRPAFRNGRPARLAVNTERNCPDAPTPAIGWPAGSSDRSGRGAVHEVCKLLPAVAKDTVCIIRFYGEGCLSA